MEVPQWLRREPPARTLEEFRARAARDPRVEPHTLSTGEQFGLMGCLLGVGGLIWLLSLAPGLAWLWNYGRLTTPLPLLATLVAFLAWRERVAERRRRSP